MRALLFVWALVAPSGVAAQPIQEQARRPPPLEPLPSCEIWNGTISGNDASAQVSARICPAPGGGEAITGVFQWSSLTSGWNRRELAGTWLDARARLEMRDTRLIEERPQPGWRFCTVDRYVLRRTAPDRLEGHYDSAACRDHATVSLTLQGTGPRPAELPAQPVLPPPPPPAPPSVGLGGCHCATATSPFSALGLAAFGALALVVALRRRRAAAVILAALVLAACGDDDAAPRDGGPPDAGPPPDIGPPPPRCDETPPIDPDAGPPAFENKCAAAVVTTGFGMHWTEHNHYLARYAIRPRFGALHVPGGCPAGSVSRGGELVAALEGLASTPVPDGGTIAAESAFARYDYAVAGAAFPPSMPVDAGPIDAGPPETPPIRSVRGEAVIDLVAADEGSLTVPVDLAAAGLADATELVALIAGVELETDVPQGPDYPSEWQPAYGYAVRAFAASIGVATREMDTLSFEARATFAPGLAAPLEMNRAAVVARTRVVVHWIVLALADGVASPGAAEASFSASCGEPASSTVTAAGHVEHDHFLAGLGAFSFVFRPAGAGERAGDYVRSLSVALRDVTRDPSTGALSVRVEASAENGGPTAVAALEYDFDAAVHVAEWTGGPDIVHRTIAIPLGETTTTAPLDW